MALGISKHFFYMFFANPVGGLKGKGRISASPCIWFANIATAIRAPALTDGLTLIFGWWLRMQLLITFDPALMNHASARSFI